MYGFRWERWSALAGVLFVALFMVGWSISENGEDTSAKLQAYYRLVTENVERLSRALAA